MKVAGIELLGVPPRDRSKLSTLLDAYLNELAGHREIAVGAITASDYPYLDAYFREPGRHPFFIADRGVVVGFALVRDPESTGSVREMAEFYVKPSRRRLGVGAAAIELLWRRFPGDWELQVHARNEIAMRFWTACIDRVASTESSVTHIKANDGRRIQFNFRVG